MVPVFLPLSPPKIGVLAIDHDRCAAHMTLGKGGVAGRNTRVFANLVKKVFVGVNEIVLVSFSNRQSQQVNDFLNKGQAKPTNIEHLYTISAILRQCGVSNITVLPEYFLPHPFLDLSDFKRFASTDDKTSLVSAILSFFPQRASFLFVDDVAEFLPRPSVNVSSVQFMPAVQDPSTLRLSH